MRREDRDSLWERFKAICRDDTERDIDLLEQRLESQEEYLGSKKEQKQKLEDMLADARSDEHQDQVRGWLDEVEEKINEVENSMETLNSKISELRERL